MHTDNVHLNFYIGYSIKLRSDGGNIDILTETPVHQHLVAYSTKELHWPQLHAIAKSNCKSKVNDKCLI